MRIVLSAPGSLLEALRTLVPGASNRTLRQMIRHECVRLNGKINKIPSQPTGAGDVLEISRAASVTGRAGAVRILYEDKDVLVIHKPAGLLTVATLHERERTAYAYLREHVRTRNPRAKLFIVHRLDKFVSGLLVFAKSEVVKMKLQKLFEQHDIDRKYWAIVEGQVKDDHGTISSRLAQDQTGRMRSTPGQGKQAVTHYRVLRRFPTLTSIEVTLETGRKNQIRAHLSEMGHPIVGDLAYGSTINPLGRMGLHAFLLGFRHPSRGTHLVHSTGPPREFRRYIRQNS